MIAGASSRPEAEKESRRLSRRLSRGAVSTPNPTTYGGRRPSGGANSDAGSPIPAGTRRE
ncbi:hypothetical protein GCM10009734_72780 [Nonomuraea bangladeshensis]